MAYSLARTPINPPSRKTADRSLVLPQSLYIATVTLYLCYLAVTVAIVFR